METTRLTADFPGELDGGHQDFVARFDMVRQATMSEWAFGPFLSNKEDSSESACFRVFSSEPQGVA